jgi:hypothetical protein
MSFSDMKNNARGSLESLQQKLEETNKTNSYKDDRLWRAELDKSSNGYAEIRFLPAPKNEDLPWARLYSHAFKGPGGWYIENSLTTKGGKDPVSEMNSQLWNSGLDSDKDIARERRRKLQYISNIYVISDPANPQNEGKVFLYKYGKKIFDKINEAMNPEFQDEEAVNPFNFWTGATFKLKVRKVAGYVNYDKSHFDPSSPLNEDDGELERIWTSQYSLTDLVADDKFKSYDELSNRIQQVLGGDSRASATSESSTVEEQTSTAVTSDPQPKEEESAMSFFERQLNDD